MQYPQHHDEVLKSLERIGNATLGQRIGVDRGSQLEYCGVRVPQRRKLVEKGFTFCTSNSQTVLAVWNDLWQNSNNGDVLFCALDYYRDRVKKEVDSQYWPIMRDWVDRIDNWAHSDDLSAIYSRLLEADFDEVYPTLQSWNTSEELWHKRISIVSLIHYTGENAVFLGPTEVLPLVQNCVADHRPYIQKATGWVLREMHRKFPEEIEEFLSLNLAQIGSVGLTRAIEKLSAEEKSRWRAQRKARLAAKS